MVEQRRGASRGAPVETSRPPVGRVAARNERRIETPRTGDADRQACLGKVPVLGVGVSVVVRSVHAWRSRSTAHRARGVLVRCRAASRSPGLRWASAVTGCMPSRVVRTTRSMSCSVPTVRRSARSRSCPRCATRESIIEITRLQARLEAVKCRLLDHGTIVGVHVVPDPDDGPVTRPLPATTPAAWYAGAVRDPDRGREDCGAGGQAARGLLPRHRPGTGCGPDHRRARRGDRGRGRRAARLRPRARAACSRAAPARAGGPLRPPHLEEARPAPAPRDRPRRRRRPAGPAARGRGGPGSAQDLLPPAS